MTSLLDATTKVKRSMKLASGFKIEATTSAGTAIHGGTHITNEAALKALCAQKPDSLRIASFSEKFASCVGFGVNVQVVFLGEPVEPRLSLENFAAP